MSLSIKSLTVVHSATELLGPHSCHHCPGYNRTTALDAELFATRLSVVKATSFDVKHIVIIIDSLTAARRAVDASVHSGQAYSLCYRPSS